MKGYSTGPGDPDESGKTALTAAFATAAASEFPEVEMEFYVEWNRSADPWTEAGANWVEETDNVFGIKLGSMMSIPGEDMMPPDDEGVGTVLLANKARRYSWLRGSGGDETIRSYIDSGAGLKGKRVRFKVGFVISGTAELVTSFTGVIDDWTENHENATVLLEITGLGGELIQMRSSSEMEQNTNASAWIEEITTNHANIDSTMMNLDIAILEIPFAWLSKDSVLEDAWNAAASEGGRCYFDDYGVLRFENMAHWLATEHQTSRWTFTQDDFDKMTPVHEVKALATDVVIEWSGRFIDAETEVYKLDRTKFIRPGESVSFEARLVNPVIEVRTPEVGDDVEDYYFVSTGGVPMNEDCTVNLDIKAQEVEVTVTNNHSDMAAVLRFFQLRGIPLSGGPSEEVEGAVPVGEEPFTYTVERSDRGNPYMQTQRHINVILPLILDRAKNIWPAFRLEGCNPVPHLERGDRVTFQDVEALGGTRTGMIVGVEHDYSSKGYSQSFIILDDEHMFDAGSTYFEFGVTALGAGVAYF